jgi:hypothetical protein
MLTANWLGLPSAATTELVAATGIFGIAVKAGSKEAAALGSHLIEDRDSLHLLRRGSMTTQELSRGRWRVLKSGRECGNIDCHVEGPFCGLW